MDVMDDVTKFIIGGEDETLLEKKDRKSTRLKMNR